MASRGTSSQVSSQMMRCSRLFPFALSMSKGRSWFDKPVLSEAEGLTTNGNSAFRPHIAGEHAC